MRIDFDMSTNRAPGLLIYYIGTDTILLRLFYQLEFGQTMKERVIFRAGREYVHFIDAAARIGVHPLMVYDCIVYDRLPSANVGGDKYVAADCLHRIKIE